MAGHKGKPAGGQKFRDDQKGNRDARNGRGVDKAPRPGPLPKDPELEE
jgi:hypothetical protein